MKNRHKRAALIIGSLSTLGIACVLVLNAFQSNLVFFFTPSQISAGDAPEGRTFRVGGMVQAGSVQRLPDGLTVRFTVTDNKHAIPVTYTGILPDLFREGKGVVAQGSLTGDGSFHAKEVLAKHDENYMPPEAQHALDEAAKATHTVKR